MVFVTVIYVQQKTLAEAPKIVLVRLGVEGDAASPDTASGSAEVVCVRLCVFLCPSRSLCLLLLTSFFFSFGCYLLFFLVWTVMGDY